MLQILNLRQPVHRSGGGGKLPHHCNEDVAAFYSSLAEGLDKLEKLVGTDFISADFMVAAVDLLRSTHAEALLLVEKLRLPVSANGEEWLNDYMDETVKLLEVCNVLKSAVGGLERYQNRVGVVVRTLNVQAPGIAARHHFHRVIQTLNACKQQMLQTEIDHKTLIENRIEAGGKLPVTLADKHVENRFVKWNGFWGVLFTLKNTSSYICRLLLSAIVYVGPIPTLNTEVVPVKSFWSFSLVQLHQRVTEEMARAAIGRKCPFMFSSEVEALEGGLGDMRNYLQIASRGNSSFSREDQLFKRALQMLKDGSQKLQAGMDTMDWHINDLFDDVVEGRNKLLNLFNNC